MAIATTLPAKRVTLRFPPQTDASESDAAEDSYQLLELPAEILKQIEGKDAPLRYDWSAFINIQLAQRSSSPWSDKLIVAV